MGQALQASPVSVPEQLPGHPEQPRPFLCTNRRMMYTAAMMMITYTKILSQDMVNLVCSIRVTAQWLIRVRSMFVDAESAPNQATIMESAISRDKVTRPPRTPTTRELSLLLTTLISVPGNMPMAAKWPINCRLDFMQATNLFSPCCTLERGHWALKLQPGHLPCRCFPRRLHRLPENISLPRQDHAIRYGES